MATDLMQVMRMLGHERFIAVGHDRGGHAVRPDRCGHP
jgi:pimeloyl-ACP methyl ester carboxylesterase